MRMDTSKVIDNLVLDLKPVRVLPHPVARAVVSSIVGLALIACIVPLAGLRGDWPVLLQAPLHAASLVLMLISGVLSAAAAFILSTPDTKIRKPVILLLSGSAAIWLTLCLMAALFLTSQNAGAEISTSGCVKTFVTLLLVPLIVSFMMTLRGAPVWGGWAGYALTQSMASFSAMGVRFFCPDDTGSHLLVWHFLPVLVASLTGIVLGKGILLLRRRVL